MKDTTIAAIATFPAVSAIGVIRVSGKDTQKIVSGIFYPNNPDNRFVPNSAVPGKIKDGPEILDEAVLTFFRSPRSFTGEDTAEISCHGNPYILYSIMNLLIKNGCVPAGPGEFTKRAFLNGKIDLSQAEAIADTIAADNPAALKLAMSQLAGRERSAITGLRKGILDLLARVEAEIDFAHEDIERTSRVDAAAAAAALAEKVKLLVKNADEGIMLKQGIRLVICGRPNTGKSRLLNTLLKKDRAIVTSMPGTTRDIIEDRMVIDGLPFRLIDTAGIRAARNPAEKSGIKRASAALKTADVIIFLIDGSSRLSKTDSGLYARIKNKNIVVAINKSDLRQRTTAGKASGFFPLPPSCPVVKISALKNTGIKDLTNAVKNIIISKAAPVPLGEVLVANLRHKTCLKRAAAALGAAVKALGKNSFEAAAFDLKEAAVAAGAVIGEISSDDVLDGIFKNFCIGK
jgi:tRNA modification GTPase